MRGMGTRSKAGCASCGLLVREALIAVAVAAVLAWVLPMQAFLGNSSLYTFGLARLVAELGVVFVAFSLVLFALLVASSLFLRGAFSLLFSALFCNVNRFKFAHDVFVGALVSPNLGINA